MSVELDVVCVELPDAEQVGRLVGPFMAMVLNRPVIHALVNPEPEHDGWTLLWDTTSTVVTWWPRGRFEYPDRWSVDVQLGQRGIALSLLLMFMTAAAVAVLGDGRILDEAKLVNGGRLSRRELYG